MVEKASPTPDFVTSKELEAGITNGRITTFTITKENLPDYLKAAGETDFKVEVIAQEDQYYVTEKISSPPKRTSSTNGQENKAPTITAVKSKSPVKAGYVGISLERPKDVTTDTAFNLKRQGAEQKRLQQEQEDRKKA